MSANLHFMVRVSCMTYNHENYIVDALNGFVMQQTSFPVVYTIVDDASTDNNVQVIKKFVEDNFDLQDDSIAYEKDFDYGHVVFARHHTNTNCFFAVVFLKENHYSQHKTKAPYLKEWMDTKYVAMCEGDDYWTDPLKLQKQVSFLEEHPDYSLCCHRYKIFDQNDGKWEDDYVKKMFEIFPDGFSFGNYENLIKAWMTKTMTLVYRRSCLNTEDLNKYHYRCDEHLNYHLLRNGLGYCCPFVGAVYRRCDSGVFSVLSKKEKFERWCRIRGEMLEYNITDKDLRDDAFVNLRWYLSNKQFCSEMAKVLKVCLISFYKTEGIKATFICSKQLFSSLVKGLKKNDKKSRSN